MSEQPDHPTVLVVDDEQHIRELVRIGLALQGYGVLEAASGRDALELVDREQPDLVVLDVMLPDIDGFEVTRRLRRMDDAQRELPILFLSARDTTADRIEGLRLGSDDYLTKPFSVEELVERVRAVLRRSSAPSPSSDRLTYEDLTLDEQTRDVWRGERFIELTPTEYRLLHFLLANPRRVLTREQLLEHVWDYDFTSNASVLETYISYLRAKVDATDPPLIHTVRGVGYVLRRPR